MNKILVVARNEFLIAITSKAFLVGLVMMPIFMGGALAVQYLAKDQVDLTSRKIAIADQTGRLGEIIQQRATTRNEQQIFAGEGDDRRQTAAKFEIEILSIENAAADQLQFTQSDRVRSKDLFAFAIIEPTGFDATGNGVIRYHSESPSYQSLSK